MSLRVGLRYMRKPLAKTYLQLSGNPEIPYYLRIYIIRNRWVISALYYSRIRDSITFKPLSTDGYELQESVSKPEDDYSMATADRVYVSLEETVNTDEVLTMVTFDRVIVNAEDSSSISDDYSMATADRVYVSIPTPLEETVSAEDAYNIEVSNLIVYRLQDAVHASDTYNIVKADMVKRRLVEEVHAHEVGLQSAPWEEDPTKKLWGYFDFEKVLAMDEYSVFIVKPDIVVTLDPVDVTETEATLRGYLVGDGWVERGFEWGTKPGIYEYEWTESGVFTEGEFSYRVTGLKPNTKYYYRVKGRKA